MSVSARGSSIAVGTNRIGLVIYVGTVDGERERRYACSLHDESGGLQTLGGRLRTVHVPVVVL